MLAACYIMVTAIRPHAMSLAGLASEKASFFLTKFVSVDHILRYSKVHMSEATCAKTAGAPLQIRNLSL
eukprot:scaffold2663_cov156-Skeletonema_marinoi.AAC.3